MVLLQIDPEGRSVFPFEGHAPGPVDVQAVPNRPRAQPMEVEARDVQLARRLGLVQHLQPDERATLQVGSDAGAPSSLEQLAESRMPECPNHFAECRA